MEHAEFNKMVIGTELKNLCINESFYISMNIFAEIRYCIFELDIPSCFTFTFNPLMADIRKAVSDIERINYET